MNLVRCSCAAFTGLIAINFLLLATACGSGSTSAADESENFHTMNEVEMGLMNDNEQNMASHPPRIPNGNARIELLSPQSGETIGTNEKISVEVAVSNFPLSVDGNHWHIYVDGQSARMVLGTIEHTMIGPLAPGQHEIAVFLSPDSHEELEQGDSSYIEVINK